MSTVLCELVDPLGNRLIVEPLNTRSVIIRIIQDDGGIDGTAPAQDAQVIIGYDELQRLAAVVEEDRPCA